MRAVAGNQKSFSTFGAPKAHENSVEMSEKSELCELSLLLHGLLIGAS